VEDGRPLAEAHLTPSTLRAALWPSRYRPRPPPSLRASAFTDRTSSRPLSVARQTTLTTLSNSSGAITGRQLLRFPGLGLTLSGYSRAPRPVFRFRSGRHLLLRSSHHRRDPANELGGAPNSLSSFWRGAGEGGLWLQQGFWMPCCLRFGTCLEVCRRFLPLAGPTGPDSLHCCHGIGEVNTPTFTSLLSLHLSVVVSLPGPRLPRI